VIKKISSILFVIFSLTTLACSLSGQTASTENAPTFTFTPFQSTATFTEIAPTATLDPTSTVTPDPGSIVFDFVAMLCNAKWMNGAQNLAACPDVNSDHSGGYAVVIDPATEGLAANTPVILTIPAWNGNAALFLRYPSFIVNTGDRFRATLRCQTSAACDVAYALEYYDSAGKYHSPFMSWNYAAGDPALNIDVDLNSLAGQTVDFVLAIRPNNDAPQQDGSLWIAPHIYRPTP
jgi:hypothetical protein